MITASNSHIVTLDNLSRIEQWLSDALCRLATGGGLATRQLYTDEEEVIFDAQRPVLLNGIEEVAVKGDLLDRMVTLSLPGISDKEHREEEVFWKEFEAERPLILGALLSGVSAALRNIDKVKLEKKPRMADFAIWASAAECELGFKEGAFIEAYTNNRKEASDIALESSPVATEVYEFMRDKNKWEGTFGELLASLNARVSKGSRTGRALPISARAFSNESTRLTPNLRNAGITFHRLPREAASQITKPQAKSKLRSFLQARSGSDGTPRIALSLKCFIEGDFDKYLPKRAPITRRVHMNPLNNHILNTNLAAFELTDLTLQDFQDLIDVEIKKFEGGKLSWDTVKNILKVFSSVLGHAVKREILKTNPAKYVTLPQKPVKQWVLAKPEKIDELIRQLPIQRATMVRLLPRPG